MSNAMNHEPQPSLYDDPTIWYLIDGLTATLKAHNIPFVLSMRDPGTGHVISDCHVPEVEQPRQFRSLSIRRAS